MLLLVVLLRMDNLAQLWAAFKGAEVLVLLGAALLNALNIQLKVIRWQVLLATRGYHYPAAAAWRAILPSMYIGMLTPGRVGDVLRVQYTRRDIDVPYAEGLAIIVMDRFCDLYVLLGFVVAGVAHFANVLRGDLGWMTWLAVGTIAVLPLLLLVKGPADRLLEAVYQRLSKNTERGPEGGRRFLVALRAQLGRRLLLTLPLTVGAFLVHYLVGCAGTGSESELRRRDVHVGHHQLAQFAAHQHVGGRGARVVHGAGVPDLGLQRTTRSGLRAAGFCGGVSGHHVGRLRGLADVSATSSANSSARAETAPEQRMSDIGLRGDSGSARGRTDVQGCRQALRSVDNSEPETR